MAITDFDKNKPIEVTSATDTPTISRALCFKITSGDDSTTGTGEIVLDWSNISSQADIGVYDENDNLLDYYFEFFDATNETAVIWVYRDWVRDGSTQAKIAYGNGPSDQSVVASTVFDKEANLQSGYLLSESSGPINDITSTGNDGTVVDYPDLAVDGIVGKACNTSNGYIQLPKSAFDSIYSYGLVAILFWFRDSQDSISADNYLFSVEGAWAVFRKYTDNGEISCFFSGSRSSAIKSNNATNDGVWHCLVAQYDGTTQYLYIDGSLHAQSDVSLYDTTSLDRYSNIGCQYDGDPESYFGGDLDDVRVLEGNYTTDEINAYYLATKPTPELFSQQAAVATVATDSPTNVTGSSATLNGILEDLQGNSSLDVYFEWGTNTSYGNTTAAQIISSVPTSFDADISGLTAFTTYHYRAVATDGTNYWYGSDASFYTADLSDVDETQADFQEGTLTDVEADAGDYLKIAYPPAFDFDVDNYITASPLSKTYTEFTLEVWTKPGDFSSTKFCILTNDLWNSPHFYFDIRNGSDMSLSIYNDDGSTVYSTFGFSITESIGPNEKHHIALSIGVSEINIYVDGNLAKTIDISTSLSATFSLDHNIGRRNDSDDRHYLGWMSDFRIWDHARTQAEIQNNMSSRLNGDETGLDHYYKMDEGSGTTITDSTGNSNGTVNEGEHWTTASLYLGGNRLSPQLDLSSLGTLNDTLIEWNEIVSDSISVVDSGTAITARTNWNARPVIEKLPNGNWAFVYREASQHTADNDAKLHIRFSDDEGTTWTSDDTLLSGSAVSGFPLDSGYAEQDVDLVVCPSGDLIVLVGLKDASTGDLIKSRISRSIDGGASWDSFVTVTWNSTGGYPEEGLFLGQDHTIVDNTIYVTVFVDPDADGVSPYGTGLARSTDDGQSWDYIIDVVSPSDSEDANEAGIIGIGGSDLLVVMRHADSTKTYQTVVYDGGDSIGTIEDIAASVGVIQKPRLNFFPDNELILIGARNPGSMRYCTVASSKDLGETWGNLTDIHDAEDEGYSDVTQRDDGRFYVVTGKGTTSDADIYKATFDLSEVTSITIETRYSLDGGSTWSSWQTATSGDPIPGLSSGDDLSNALLECRETLSTSDTTTTPQLESRSIYIAEYKSFTIALPAIRTQNKVSISGIGGFFSADYFITLPKIRSETRVSIKDLHTGYPHIVCNVQPERIATVMGILAGDINAVINTN